MAEVGGLRLRLNPPCGLGIAAAARAITATVVSMLFFGWLLLIATGIEVAQAVMVGHWAGFFHHLPAAILVGVTGFTSGM